jgi:hypothetical protein
MEIPTSVFKSITDEKTISPSSAALLSGLRTLAETGNWVPISTESEKGYTTTPTMPNTQPEVVEYWVTCSVPSNYLWGVCLKIKTDVSVSGHIHPAPDLPFTGNPACVSNIPGGEKISWYVKVPEYSGNFTFTATGYGSCYGTTSQILTVKIQGLMNMPEGYGYQLVGSTRTHPNNHYLQPNNIGALQNIAREYKIEFPDDPNLFYNDMSLVWGGLFDINNNWQPDHKTHRLGNHVDIQMTTIPSEHRQEFINIACKYAYAYLEEGRHYHLSFANSYSKDYKVEELPENSVYYKALCTQK